MGAGWGGASGASGLGQRIGSAARRTFVALLFNVDADQAAAGVPLSAYIDGFRSHDQEHAHALIRRSIDEAIPFVAVYRVLSADGLTRRVLGGDAIRDTSTLR